MVCHAERVFEHVLTHFSQLDKCSAISSPAAWHGTKYVSVSAAINRLIHRGELQHGPVIFLPICGKNPLFKSEGSQVKVWLLAGFRKTERHLAKNFEGHHAVKIPES